MVTIIFSMIFPICTYGQPTHESELIAQDKGRRFRYPWERSPFVPNGRTFHANLRLRF